MRERLIARDANRKPDTGGKPTLKLKPGDGKPVEDDSATPEDRPTLKRHDFND
jgi:hypothetical protein